MNRAAGPIGYFVHHQGRGHAERAAAFANALSAEREITLFCARDDIFPALGAHVSLSVIPSLFEQDGSEGGDFAGVETPDTLHCAPLGWPSITRAIGALTNWFVEAEPALFITDVSAELAQLARIASIPHVTVLQHGDRSDPGHMASYRSAVGILAPFARSLEQSDRPAWMRKKTIYAPGLGIDCSRIGPKEAARKKLGLTLDTDIVVVLGGGGGTGLPSAPLTLGARGEPAATWITLGKMQTEWHETPPANLHHLGWIENPEDWISAADRIVSSCGNTTVHMVASAGKPWVVVPEWRYFSEQVCKAEALDSAGAAAMSRIWPSSAGDWRKLWQSAALVNPDNQRDLVQPDAARQAAHDIEQLITSIWAEPKTIKLSKTVSKA